MPLTLKAHTPLLLGAACLIATGAACADADPDADELPDAIAPWVISCAPPHGAIGQSTNARPAVNFSEEMNPATVNSRSFWLSGPGGAPVRGEILYLGQTASFMPEAALQPGTLYTVTIAAGARDRDGNALVRDYACSFSTAPVLSSAPAPVLAPAPTPVVVVPLRRERRWYLAPMLAYDFPTCNECVDHGPGWQLAFGKAINDRWNFELSAVDRDLDLSRVPGSSHDSSLGLNLLWFPDRYQRFAPFVLVGAGANKQEQDPNKESTVPYGTGGAGFLIDPWFWNATFRMGVQWLRPFGGDYCGKGDTIASVGFHIPFGR